MSEATQPLLELRDVSKVYTRGEQEVRALDDVSVSIAPGELVAVVAPSGAGKSTLLNIMGALDRPTSGTVRFRGRDITALTDTEQSLFRRTNIGFVFQFFNLLPTLSAWENVTVPRLLAGTSFRAAKADAVQLLGRVGLAERVDHRPGELSGGQIQRVALARALIMSPDLIVADEPTGNLDSHSGDEVFELLAQVARDEQADRAVIIATHDAQVAARCDRQIKLLDGRLVS